MQKKNESNSDQLVIGKLRWEISVDDFSKEPARPGMIPYQLTFILCNDYDFPLRVKVQITSPSKGFMFRKRIYKKVGRSRITKIDNVLTQIIKQEIPSLQMKQIGFVAHFYPTLFPASSTLKLNYQISARNKEHQFSIKSNIYELDVSIK
ncbi:MAG: hypothetical protein ACFFCF_04895 [Promethearchaeota archaeon]